MGSDLGLYNTPHYNMPHNNMRFLNNTVMLWLQNVLTTIGNDHSYGPKHSVTKGCSCTKKRKEKAALLF